MSVRLDSKFKLKVRYVTDNLVVLSQSAQGHKVKMFFA